MDSDTLLGQTIPEATYDELVNSPSPDLFDRIKRCGSVVIHGTVSKEQVSSLVSLLACNTDMT